MSADVGSPMGKALTWLSDADWARIEPLPPSGRCGARRVDGRRVISGIVHMLRIGARWRDCPAEYGPYTTICNPFSPGNTSDMTMAPALIKPHGAGSTGARGSRLRQHAIRAAIAAQGAEVVIPPTRSRKTPIAYDCHAYRARNLGERLWCRLKDWRRIATRYDKLAANYMAGVFLAAIITFWGD